LRLPELEAGVHRRNFEGAEKDEVRGEEERLKTVYLGLGSNIGDREGHLRAAIERLEGVRRVSPIYETEPVDYTEQGWFLNLVVEAETELFPMQLLGRTARIEREMGRVRTLPKGPRTIDIDILLYGGSVVQSKRLVIPHPRMAERRFVLAPLADLAPELRHPVIGKTIRELLVGAPQQVVRRWSGESA
jgi:2-amino-4-hydroxy-6-hydroxymethyldihydropteridine diphosphokinase